MSLTHLFNLFFLIQGRVHVIDHVLIPKPEYFQLRNGEFHIW
jgi:hypothetical protein